MSDNSVMEIMCSIFESMPVSDEKKAIMSILGNIGKILDLSNIAIFRRSGRQVIMVDEWISSGSSSVSYLAEKDVFDASAQLIIGDTAEYHDNFFSGHGIGSIVISPLEDISCFLCFIDDDKRIWKDHELCIIRLVASHFRTDFFQAGILRTADDHTFTKALLENILENTCDAIFYTDMDGKIIYWNKAAQDMLDIDQKDAIGRSIFDIDADFRKDLLKKSYDSLSCSEKKIYNHYFDLKTRKGIKKHISASLSIVMDKEKQVGVVSVLRNNPALDSGRHNIECGSSYFHLSGKNTSLISYFIRKADPKNSLYLTRNPEKRIPSMIKDTSIPVVQIGADVDSIPENILKKVRTYAEKGTMIMFDRPDYLIGLYGFDDFLRFLYDVNDIIKKTRSVFLLYLNPVMFDRKQLFYISQELEELILTANALSVPAELIDIMRFLKENSTKGQMVSMMDISKRFRITRPTTLERVKRLQEIGMIETEKIGRFRSIALTDLGYSFLN